MSITKIVLGLIPCFLGFGRNQSFRYKEEIQEELNKIFIANRIEGPTNIARPFKVPLKFKVALLKAGSNGSAFHLAGVNIHLKAKRKPNIHRQICHAAIFEI